VRIDLTAAARRADPNRAREWLAEQRVFISSAMADTAVERRAAVQAVQAEGATPVWFEEFGRDADPEQAYLTEVDWATIYVAILNEQYGRPLPSGYSATEVEYLRARERGKRTAVYTAADAPGREGHLGRFIDRIRMFVVTEAFANEGDLERRVRRRLQELAAEALSPWVKLGDHVFRADLIDDMGATITIAARIGDEIGHALDELSGRHVAGARVSFAYEDCVVSGEVARVRRTVRARGVSDRVIELARVERARPDAMRPATAGHSADELVQFGLRHLLLAEPLPEAVERLAFTTDTGIGVDALRQCFDLPNEIAEAVTRLVITDGLVGTGRAARVASLSLGPRVGDRRRIAVHWLDPRGHANVEPARRSFEGDWVRAGSQ